MKTENPQPLDLEDFRKSWKSFLYADIDMTIPDDFWEELKQRIKSACNFYLKYRWNAKLFIKDYPEYKKDVEKKFGVILSNKEWYIEESPPEFAEYESWLFKLAFKDIFKEK